MRSCFFLFFAATLLLAATASAQLFPRRAQQGAEPPKALLVSILTRKSQRDYLRQHRPDLLPEFERDVTAVTHRIIMDFSGYFKFCPVYYFYDSTSDKIAQGLFEGVLLDSSLHAVTQSVLSPGETNFFIAQYGNPIPQPDYVRPASPNDLGGDREMYGDDPTALYREKLLVCDSRFLLLSRNGPRTNYARTLRPAEMSTAKYRAYRKKITYNAARWYIDYMPCAYSYDQTLRRFFRTK